MCMSTGQAPTGMGVAVEKYGCKFPHDSRSNMSMLDSIARANPKRKYFAQGSCEEISDMGVCAFFSTSPGMEILFTDFARKPFYGNFTKKFLQSSCAQILQEDFASRYCTEAW